MVRKEKEMFSSKTSLLGFRGRGSFFYDRKRGRRRECVTADDRTKCFMHKQAQDYLLMETPADNLHVTGDRLCDSICESGKVRYGKRFSADALVPA